MCRSIALAGLLGGFMTACSSKSSTSDSDSSLFGNIVSGTLGAVGVDPTVAQAAGAATTIGTRAYELDQLTPENEYYIGRAVAANLVGRYGLYQNDSATRYVNLVGHALAQGSDMPETFGGYHFLILDTDELNAFGAPGGYVLITRGMLKDCKTEDALAAVLAHEIAHVQNRDGLNAIKSSEMWKTGLQEGTKLAAQGNLAAATGLFDKLIDGFVIQLIEKGYSRSAEGKADVTGVGIMQRVGYDPHGMVVMLEEIKADWKPGFGMARTHPTPDQRLEKVQPLVSGAAAPSTTRQARFDEAMMSVK
jgi:predicted Zn-dependent protease